MNSSKFSSPMTPSSNVVKLVSIISSKFCKIKFNHWAQIKKRIFTYLLLLAIKLSNRWINQINQMLLRVAKFWKLIMTKRAQLSHNPWQIDLWFRKLITPMLHSRQTTKRFFLETKEQIAKVFKKWGIF